MKRIYFSIIFLLGARALASQENLEVNDDLHLLDGSAKNHANGEICIGTEC